MFQPAEEGVRGAQPMIAAGVTEGVDRMLAVHLGGDLPAGRAAAVRGGSDDAHLLIREVQEAGGLGTYIFVGASNPALHHHRQFDVDENATVVAVDLLERLFRD